MVSLSKVTPNKLCIEGFNLTPILSSGITCLTASKTSKNSLALFSLEPPYSSVLLFDVALKN